MRPIVYSYQPTATDDDAICLSQTPAGAGDLLINGVLAAGGVATMGAQQHVTIISGANISNRTFDIYGTDGSGATNSKLSVTGPNIATVEVLTNFKTITRIAISGAAAGALTVGVNGKGEGYPLPLDYIADPTSVAIACVITGSPTYTVQHSFDDPFTATYDQAAATWFDHDSSALVGATANQDGNYAFPPRVSRIKVSSTSGGVTMTVIQSGP